MPDQAEAGVGPGQVAGLHDLLESAQMVLNLLPRFLAEQFGDLRPDSAAGRIDLHVDVTTVPRPPGAS